MTFQIPNHSDSQIVPCSGACKAVPKIVSTTQTQTPRPVAVIKIGGSLVREGDVLSAMVRDIVALNASGMDTVVVHGGGPEISEALLKFGVSYSFCGGKRQTTPEAMEVVEMVLSGRVNRRIVEEFNANGVFACGFSGKDARSVECEPEDPALGLVGRPVKLNRQLLEGCFALGATPVMAPIGVDKNNVSYNINGDTLAGFIAASVGAQSLVLLTDVDGVCDDQGRVISDLTARDHRVLKDSGVISGGMIPKVQTAMEATQSGVPYASIIDGRKPQACLHAASGMRVNGTRMVAA